MLESNCAESACCGNGMAMYVRWWMVKGGQDGKAGRTEQFDAVHPVHPVVASATWEYLEGYWNHLKAGHGTDAHGLGPEGPLFPSGRVTTKRMSNEQVYVWFRNAARLLGERYTPRGVTPNNAHHGLRYNRRTELGGLNAKYAR